MISAKMTTRGSESFGDPTMGPTRGPSRLALQSAQAAERQGVSDAFIQASYDKAEAARQGSFEYRKTVQTATSKKPWEADQVAYVAKMERGGFVQPHGVMLLVEPPVAYAPKLHLVAYSENAAEILGLNSEEVKVGSNACNFFSDSCAMQLYKEVGAKGAFHNPIMLQLKHKPLECYAILTRSESGVMIDLEPVVPPFEDLSVASNEYIDQLHGGNKEKAITMGEARQAAQKAVDRLQNFPSGSVETLCCAVVQEMRDFLCYDRAMVYKFHPDQHGEVVAESVREDMEPYLGIHYPATDLPQAARTNLLHVGSRLICNAAQPQARVIQTSTTPVNLGDSNLRAPHSCHTSYMSNMGSMASLTLAVLTDDKKDDLDPNENFEGKKKLWGLVVCHHNTPRYTPYPLRKAGEYLLQGFGKLLNREVLQEANFHEENILNMQKKLCDMLESHVPLGIVQDHPNVMDLVKCDGSALLFNGRFWRLGLCPTERQIQDIADWICKQHKRKHAICTDSLAEAGYPLANELVPDVCGLVAIKISSPQQDTSAASSSSSAPQPLSGGDFVFWFRSHTAKEVRWGGKKHMAGEVDDENLRVPRNSFQAFLDVVKKRSLPWLDVELEAINGLRLMLKGALELARKSPLQFANLEGGTDIDGKGRRANSGQFVKLPKDMPLHLSEEAEVMLTCFKASFVVTDGKQDKCPIVFCSEAFTVLTGYSQRDMMHQDWHMLEGADTDLSEGVKLKSAMTTGATYAGRVLHYKKDGTPFWDLVTMAPVKDNASGAVLNHVLLFQEVAKYTEAQNVGIARSPSVASGSGSFSASNSAAAAAEKGFPVSLIRYDGRLKEKAVRKVLEIAQAVKSPGRARVDGPLTPGRLGGIAEELKIPMPASPEFAKPSHVGGPILEGTGGIGSGQSGKGADAGGGKRRSSLVGMLKGGKGEGGKSGGRKSMGYRATRSTSAVPPNKSFDFLRDPTVKKRRAAKGIDFGTTLERIEYNFLVTDPRLDENPIIFMSDEYIRLTEFSREEHIGGQLLYLEGDDTDTEELRKIHNAVQNLKDISVHIQAYKASGAVTWLLYHLSVVRDSEGNALYIINVLKDCGGTRLTDPERVKALSARAAAEASTVAEALRDLPDAAAEEKQWTIHSRTVVPKPHKFEDPAWAAIKQVKAQDGRLGLKHFRPIKPLGNGDSGSVMLVELRGTQRLFAVKVMEKESMTERNKVHRVACEREILEHLDHPFLPTLYASFQTAKHVCFVTDYCPGGEMYDLLEVQPGHRFEEKVAKFYAAEILLALEYLHCQGVVYRDLKPENILLTQSGHIVLTDFDLSAISSSFPKVMRDSKKSGKRSRRVRPSQEVKPTFVAEPVTRSNSFVGTEEYIAPEIVTGAGHTAAIDWWSFGILLYEMLYGITPFCGGSMRQTFSNILNQELYFPPEIEVSEEAIDLISLLLVRDIDERLGSQSGAAEIKIHPFFDSVRWPLIRSKAVETPKVSMSKSEMSQKGDDDEKSSLDNWRLQEMKKGNDGDSDGNAAYPVRSSDDFESWDASP
uniref:non-specific serine/threonine protein kinase n=1 Tax=Mesotaenium caldariorum TaxID=31321 RepID=A0A168YQC4_9VIRI|nr:neochrome [Mesotaenium caldariorum]